MWVNVQRVFSVFYGLVSTKQSSIAAQVRKEVMAL